MATKFPQLNSAMMEGFVASCLAKDYADATKIPQCHRELWDFFCSKEPNVAIAMPRRHAKTTAGTQAFTLASVLFRNRRYCLIVADTETQASQFLGDIIQALADNDDIHAMFGKVVFKKETTTDIICEFEDGWQFRIQAKGAGQKLRGLKWNSIRPDLICVDDLENDQDVMNKDSRDKLSRWFYGALMPCRSKNGIIRYVGTILHMDSLLENIIHKNRPKKIDELRINNIYYKTKTWLVAKYRAHSVDYLQILWDTMYDAEYFLKLKDDFREQGLLDVYNQEYLNTPIDEGSAYFRRGDLLKMTDDDYVRHKDFYIGCDLAISERQGADFTVFVVAGVDDRGILHVVDVIRERMDSEEIVSQMLALQKRYKPEFIACGNDQISKSIGPFLRSEMLRSGTFVNLQLIPQHNDKQLRARSIQGRIRVGGIRFDHDTDWWDLFEEELATFPRCKHDDQVDALAHIGMALDNLHPAQSEEELEEEEWEEEYGNSLELSVQHGANRVTGY